MERAMDEMIWGKPGPTPQGFMSHRQAVSRGRMTVAQARNYLGYPADFMIVDDPHAAVTVGHTEISLDEETIRKHADRVAQTLEEEVLRVMKTPPPMCRCTVLNP